jgi:hypothetical protein
MPTSENYDNGYAVSADKIMREEQERKLQEALADIKAAKFVETVPLPVQVPLNGEKVDKVVDILSKELERKLNSGPKYTGYPDIDEFLDDCLDTMRRKGHDYRQGNDDDVLHNFRTVAESVDSDMMKVWFTYFYKHYSAMVTFIKEGGQSESEPIEGRIKDQIVYLLLFYRMVQEKKAEPWKPVAEIARRAEELGALKKGVFAHIADVEDSAKFPTPEENPPVDVVKETIHEEKYQPKRSLDFNKGEWPHP